MTDEMLKDKGFITGWKAIADYLGVSVATATRYCELNNLPVFKIGYTRVSLPERLDEWQKDKEKWNNCVYFIYCEASSMIKIGFTSNIKNRLGNLKTMSPVPLRLIGTIEGTRVDEENLHKKFARLRSHGEWFKLERPLERYIEKVFGCLPDGIR